MKRTLILILLLGSAVGCVQERYDAAAIPSPRRDGNWVHDGAGVVANRTPDIERILDALERDTGAEVAVATVPSVGDEVPKEFATALFNAWGVGKKGKDNGVLVLHVIDQRRVEIETGYGVEATLTDSHCKRIIDEVTIPFFKAGSFADGHFETVRAIDRGLRNGGDLSGLRTRWEREPGVRLNAVPDVSQMTPVQVSRRVVTPVATIVMAVAICLWIGFIVVLALFGNPHTASKVYYWLGWAEYAAAFLGVYGLGKAGGLPDFGILLLGGLGPIAAFFWRRPIKGWLRRRPRTCGSCRTKIQEPLGDLEEDEYLEQGQVAEESVGSADYDVWHCGGCGWHRVDAHRVSSSYKRCPSCKYKTLSTTSETIVSPSYSSSGRAKVSTVCDHCGHSTTSYRSIPRLQRSTSSSSSGSSYSGGGGSFGGGSSGGGGAGGSY